MEFKKIEQFIEDCEFKVGGNINGATIDEIVPVPSDYVNEYLKFYIQYQSAESALSAFCLEKKINPVDLDYGIIAVCNKGHILMPGAFEYYIIADSI